MLHVAFCIVECCPLHATGGTVPVGGMPMLMPRMRSIICRNERSPICDNAIEWHSDRVTFHTQTHRALVTQAKPSQAKPSQAKPSQAKPTVVFAFAE
jgi:hypothetical protein